MLSRQGTYCVQAPTVCRSRHAVGGGLAGTSQSSRARGSSAKQIVGVGSSWTELEKLMWESLASVAVMGSSKTDFSLSKGAVPEMGASICFVS